MFAICFCNDGLRTAPRCHLHAIITVQLHNTTKVLPDAISHILCSSISTGYSKAIDNIVVRVPRLSTQSLGRKFNHADMAQFWTLPRRNGYLECGCNMMAIFSTDCPNGPVNEGLTEMVLPLLIRVTDQEPIYMYSMRFME